ncbi:MAG: alpha/beta fold hydrolase [Candidatus Dactylopiibacterium sp.]|nr:alpha/beta fold hydrolase [Candidatus Dactylopiibacterium sp.]
MLEILHRTPSGAPRATPLLFLHGAYSSAWLWDQHYLPWFAGQGWASCAPSLRGHGASPGRAQLARHSLDDYVDDLAGVIAAMPVKPVVIAHSMGGLVLQKYLERDTLPGVVLLCSVPPHGLLGATLQLMLTRPRVLFELNRLIGGLAPDLATVRDALFHQPVPRATLEACLAHFQPESLRAVWDMSGFALPCLARMHRPPMLILGAAHDALIPPLQVEQTGLWFGQPVAILPGHGHALMLEPDWQPAARRIAAWLTAQGF